MTIRTRARIDSAAALLILAYSAGLGLLPVLPPSTAYVYGLLVIGAAALTAIALAMFAASVRKDGAR